MHLVERSVGQLDPSDETHELNSEHWLLDGVGGSSP